MEEKKCQKKFQGHHDASLYYSENNFRFSYGGVEINAVCHQDLLCSLFFVHLLPEPFCDGDVISFGVLNVEVLCGVTERVRCSGQPAVIAFLQIVAPQLCKHWYARPSSTSTVCGPHGGDCRSHN